MFLEQINRLLADRVAKIRGVTEKVTKMVDAGAKHTVVAGVNLPIDLRDRLVALKKYYGTRTIGGTIVHVLYESLPAIEARAKAAV